ncbi:protein of unknown function [Methanocaldococcus lauensis]|uniref:Uncharacterized protein n=1 Tax=Methanocaldococcus lauensis TaxID=2546128 RepID=A0A8D6PRX9_9EURY|nr:hypothetical protein [Methanocaldococcus lauensis]CAB3287586.1 protein of unknown function [Methanocaldococcus lauensis]
MDTLTILGIGLGSLFIILPLAATIAFFYFIYKIYKNTEEMKRRNTHQTQAVNTTKDNTSIDHNKIQAMRQIVKSIKYDNRNKYDIYRTILNQFEYLFAKYILEKGYCKKYKDVFKYLENDSEIKNALEGEYKKPVYVPEFEPMGEPLLEEYFEHLIKYKEDFMQCLKGDYEGDIEPLYRKPKDLTKLRYYLNIAKVGDYIRVVKEFKKDGKELEHIWHIHC